MDERYVEILRYICSLKFKPSSIGMKRIAILLSVALMVIFCTIGAQAKKPSGPESGDAKIEFAEKTFDFGVIKEKKGPVTHEFEFTNTGDGNLLILKASAECGCTRPEYSDKPIAPGKSGKIKVTYNPVGRPGGFDKVVTVTCNGQPRKVRLKIRGTVASE